jgi:hypothetical protein
VEPTHGEHLVGAPLASASCGWDLPVPLGTATDFNIFADCCRARCESPQGAPPFWPPDVSHLDFKLQNGSLFLIVGLPDGSPGTIPVAATDILGDELPSERDCGGNSRAPDARRHAEADGAVLISPQVRK